MKNYFLVSGVLLFFALTLYPTSNSETIQTLYKSIGDGLVAIRKSHPESQQKVYSVLDHINHMYSMAKKANTQKQHLENELKTKESENMILQEELIKDKNLSQNPDEQLKTLSENLEKEKKHTQTLQSTIKKKEQLLVQKKEKQKEEFQEKELKKALLEFEQPEKQPQKLAQTKEPQNLNRTSISEPSSPR